MRFLLDENADFDLVRFLEERSHDVAAIGRDHPRALNDVEILAIAVAENRVLITNDTDFGELVFRDRLRHVGVILLRLGTETLLTHEEAMQRVLDHHGGDLREFIVASERRVRVRRSR